MRFTIRDLLWLTVVVALAVGWWTDRSRFVLALKHRDFKWALEKHRLAQDAAAYRDYIDAKAEKRVREALNASPSPSAPAGNR